jgi:hypothetical protein
LSFEDDKDIKFITRISGNVASLTLVLKPSFISGEISLASGDKLSKYRQKLRCPESYCAHGAIVVNFIIIEEGKE